MLKLLLTGASGFLGRNCLDALDQSDWEIHAVDRRPLGTVQPGVHWHEIDLLAAAEVVDLLVDVRPTHLLHLAWSGARPVYRSLENFRWVSSSLRLFQEFAACGGRRIVALGSCAEYEWGESDCAEETTPLAGDSVYGICKSSLGRMFSALCDAGGVSGAWARPFFLYGPYEHPSRLAAAVITSLLRAQSARCTHGRQIRDYLYSRDAAEALVHLLQSDFEGAVNVASGRPVSLADLVGVIGRTVGAGNLIDLGAIEATPNEAPRVVADTGRLTTEVGWKPTYSLEQGVAETVDWWKREIATSSVAKQE